MTPLNEVVPREIIDYRVLGVHPKEEIKQRIESVKSMI